MKPNYILIPKGTGYVAMSKMPDDCRQPLQNRIFQALVTAAAYILFRPKVIWEDKADRKRLESTPAVFVANHTSHFDGVFVGAVFRRYKPYVLVQKSWYEKKGVGGAIQRCRCIPIDINGADAEWYIKAETLVKNGGSMAIFPEGAIARSGKMQQFKPGAALLSASTGAVIVPCAIYGGYAKVFGKRQRVLIGKPIECHCPDDMRHSKYAKQLAAQAEAEVRRLYGTLEQRYGKLPVYKDDDFSEQLAEKETVTS